MTDNATDSNLLIGDDFVISEEEFTLQQRDKQENAFVKIEGDPRVTRVGRFIRKYSIDELPQLINILKGDMAFIGPRPLLVRYLPLYSAEQHRRHEVTPGMSGWAQVNGRDELEIPEKARLDGEYVEHLSFSFDCKCFFGTIGKVLRQEGVVEGGTGVLQKQ